MTDAQVMARIKKEQARQAKGLDAKMVCYANGLAQELSDKATETAEQFGGNKHEYFRNLRKKVDVQGVQCCIIYNMSTLNYELWLGYMD